MWPTIKEWARPDLQLSLGEMIASIRKGIRRYLQLMTLQV